MKGGRYFAIYGKKTFLSDDFKISVSIEYVFETYRKIIIQIDKKAKAQRKTS